MNTLILVAAVEDEYNHFRILHDERATLSVTLLSQSALMIPLEVLEGCLIFLRVFEGTSLRHL